MIDRPIMLGSAVQAWNLIGRTHLSILAHRPPNLGYRRCLSVVPTAASSLLVILSTRSRQFHRQGDKMPKGARLTSSWVWRRRLEDGKED
jgi:hypothetical protein